MEYTDLMATARPGLGKGAAKRLREQRLVPAIVYGGRGAATPIAVGVADLTRTMAQGDNVIIRLTLQGTGGSPPPRMVLLKELQRDPVRGRVLHVDFLEISMEKKIRVEVPIHITGEAVGVKAKEGIVDHRLRTVAVECLPLQIPERIEMDVSALDIGDSLHVRDLRVAEGVRIVEEGGRVVVSVVAPTVEAVEEAPAAAPPAEPEVVGRREKPAEGEGEEEKTEKSEKGEKRVEKSERAERAKE